MVSHHHSRWAWGTSAQHLSSSGSWPRCLFLLHNSLLHKWIIYPRHSRRIMNLILQQEVRHKALGFEHLTHCILMHFGWDLVTEDCQIPDPLRPRKKVGRCKHKQTDRPPPKEPPETKTGSSPETSSKQGGWQSCIIDYHWVPCHPDGRWEWGFDVVDRNSKLKTVTNRSNL